MFHVMRAFNATAVVLLCIALSVVASASAAQQTTSNDVDQTTSNGVDHANVVPATTSECSVSAGCPRSSMVWASGSFTEPGIITPQALALDTKLQLQLSLCCGYKFHGAMLRDAAMYDAFLDSLLYATPLRGLSMDEKRLLFPRTAAAITDTVGRRRFDATYQLTEDDIAFSNDGDGDVLSLETGPLGASIHQLPVTAGTDDGASFDMQLMLSNRVLKCKCPHTLHIMPLLSLHKDALPAVSIRGGGARCASATERVPAPQQDDSAAAVAIGDEGSISIPHTFHCVPDLPRFSHVTWDVYVVQRVANPALSSGSVAAAPTSTPDAAPILVHRSSVVTSLPNALGGGDGHLAARQGNASMDGARFTFLAEPNVRYQIRLYVAKGKAAPVEAMVAFVIRERILEAWDRVDVPLEPFFGHHRSVAMHTTVVAASPPVIGQETTTTDVLAGLLQSPEYHAHWVVFGSSAANKADLQEIRRVTMPRGVPAPNVVVQAQRGYQQLRLMLSDIDEACPAVEVERHAILAVQLLILAPAPSPFTVCANTTAVEARDERALLEDELPRRLTEDTAVIQRAGPQPLVRKAQPVGQQWRCGRVMKDDLDNSMAGAGNDQGLQRHECILSSTSNLRATWELLESSVGVLQWSLRLRLLLGPEATMAAVERFASRVVEAPLYGSIEKATASYIDLVALSPPVVAFRRRASLPVSVDVTVPTHAMHAEFAAPRQDLRGLWKTSGNAIRLASAAASPTARFDCSAAPNTPQDLPKGSVQFIVQDRGEVVSVPRPLIAWVVGEPAAGAAPPSVVEGGEPATTVDATLSFLAKCPDAAVEYTVHLKTFPPVPPVPDHETIYTELQDVRLDAPRLAAKDERVVWDVAGCADDATRGSTAALHVVPGTAAAVVRGVAPHTHCDALWTASNSAGTTTKTFALRRCEGPPPLRFGVCNASSSCTTHLDGQRPTEPITGVVRAGGASDGPPFRFDEGDDGAAAGGSDGSRRVVVLPFAVAHRVAIYPVSAAMSVRSRFATRFSLAASGASWDAVQFTSEPYDAAYASQTFPPLWSGMRRNVAVDRDGNEAYVSVESIGNDSQDDRKDAAQQLLQLRPDAGWRHDDDSQDSVSRITEVTFATRATAHGMPEPYASDMPQFVTRDLCRPVSGRFFVLNLQPLGVVASTLRDAATGLPMIEVCADVVDIARHPTLAAFGYAWTWVCDAAVFSVTAVSDVHHRFEHRSGVGDLRSLCNMTLRNHLTKGIVMQTYVVVRVFPTPLRPSDVRAQIISGNDVSSKAVERAVQQRNPAQHQSTASRLGRGGQPFIAPSAAAPTTANVLRFVGPRATLRLGGPASQVLASQLEGRNSSDRAWDAISVTPSFSTSSDYTGTALILRNVSFVMDDLAASSVEHGGGTVVRLLGFTTPGVYTLRYRQLDPAHPQACPPVSFLQLVQVYRAQVVASTTVVCSSDAVLQAVPLPQELQREYNAQWEVVSRQDAEGDDAVRTSGADLAGMRFDHSARPRTVVHGLSFGIVTVRWAIYKNVLAPSSGEERIVVSRVLVDEARVTIFVLTENLRTNRVVTLSDTIDVGITSSTYDWRFAEPSDDHRFALSRASRLHFHASNSTFKPSMMTVDRLRIGVTRLKYDLRPSARVHLWALLQNLSCPVTPPTTLFEIERVTAFLTVRQSSGSHECDAYNGRFNLTICLEAGDKVSAPFFNERVALVDAAVAERCIKEDAMAFAAATGCAVPWWTTDRAVWTSAFTFEDQRCLFVAARARHHLSPSEAAHPTFEATMPVKWTSATTARHRLVGAQCHAGTNVITSRIVEGVDVHRLDEGDASGDASGDAAPSASGIPPFLAILDPKTLRPMVQKHALLPLVGYATADDTVIMESQLAGAAGAPPAVVVLQLDTAFAKFLALNRSGGHAFLDRCIDQTLTVHDTARHWHVGLERSAVTDAQWAAYLTQAEAGTVHCEVLFASVEHMLPRASDTVDSLNARRGQPLPQHLTRFVSIVELEGQLDALNRSHHWTRDGIEVTGLPAELQSALNRRKLTRHQLAEVQRYREQQRQQRIHSEDAESSRSNGPSGELADLAPQDALLTQQPEIYRSRINKALPAYLSWVQHGGMSAGAPDGAIAAVRLTLPRGPCFAAPEHFSLRAMLHKNAVCDTNVAADPSERQDNARVAFHRVVVKDEPPSVTVSPLRIKQCDVEVAMPAMVVRLDNVNFKDVIGNMTHADLRLRVEVQEAVNANVTALLAAERSRHDYSNDEVGLKPCLGTFVRGARIAMLQGHPSSLGSQKELEIQFAPCPAFLMLSNEEYNERQEGDQLLARLQHPRLLQVTVHNVVELDSYGGSESITFTVVVAPTLVRTQLRAPGDIARNVPSPFLRSPLLTDGAPPPQQLPSVVAPMICEATLKRSGFELGLELVGDEWHNGVGASFAATDDGGHHHNDHQLLTRTQQDVALLNAFSLVEHHRLDTANFAFLFIGGGMYRSHFIHYLFSSVMVDAVVALEPRTGSQPNAVQAQKYVHRYNDSFIGIRIPPSSANSDGPAASHQTTDIVAVPFTALEEILVAVPGITTQCKGCLLADRTFFVAGDASGVWEPIGQHHRRSSSLAAPLLIPMSSLDVFPRTWMYRWLCASSAASLVHRLADRYLHHRSARGGRTPEPYLITEVHVLASRDVLGRALRPIDQPRRLFATKSVFLSDLHRSQTMGMTSFVVSDEAAEAAVDTMFTDYRRLDFKHMTTVYDYIRDPAHSGSLAVNATTILKLCLSEGECVILFYHPSLLMVRPLAGTALDVSVVGELLQPLTLLHHAGTLVVFYAYLNRRGAHSNRRASTKSDIWLPLALLACGLLLASAKVHLLWVALWLGVWSLTLREHQGIGVVALFGLHGLLYAMGAAQR